MSKVLIHDFFNNGYGCSCCRQDWEDTEWVNESEIPTMEDFFKNNLKNIVENLWVGGLVGRRYEKDGEIIFGCEPEIHKINVYLWIQKGDIDEPIEVRLTPSCLYSRSDKFDESKIEGVLKKILKFYSDDLNADNWNTEENSLL